MLDVHPPHAPTHTWRDFFIHIATISVGLILAVGLEQSVEALHHHHQREQLLEDLNREAEVRIPRIHENFKIFKINLDWYEDVLQAARAAKSDSGILTFVVPPHAKPAARIRPADSVWPSAQASGIVGLLHQNEIEVWSRVDHISQQVLASSRTAGERQDELTAVTDRLGILLVPGTTIRLSKQDSDDLLRAVAMARATYNSFVSDDANWAGASNAALHGVRHVEDIQPYEAQAQIDMRQ